MSTERPSVRSVVQAASTASSSMPAAAKASEAPDSSQPASITGLQKWVDMVKKYSKADPTKNENDQAGIFAQGEAGMFYGNAWEQGAAEQVKKDPNDPNSGAVV